MRFNFNKYIPAGNQVLMEVEVKTETDSGISFGEEQEEKFLKVVRIGDACKLVNEGDHVLVLPQAATQAVELTWNNRRFRQVPEFSIVGLLR